MKSNFSLVIINYNGANFIKRTLKNFEISDFEPNKVIIVDDCSTDDSVEIIKENFPNFILLKNEKNLGPPTSRNRGANLSEGEYIIFMDNDVLIRKDTFRQLIEFAEKNDSRAVVGAMVVPEGKEKMWWNAGYDPNNLRETIGYLIGFFLKILNYPNWLKKFSMRFILNYWDYDRPLMVDWVAETCFLVRRDIFFKVNGFDQNFFMFFEGPDLCKRIRKLGYQVWFYPLAKVDVLESHTHSTAERKIFWLNSKKYFYKKHYNFLRLLTLPIGNFISSIFYRIA